MRGCGFRRRHRRRRLCRHVHAAPPARAWLHGARVYEAGGGVGGTWYWNRYPGARCDVESMQYSFSFSEELDQQWDWSEKYAPQPEILAYANHVADRFDLRRHIVFDTRVTAASFDEDRKMLAHRDRPRRQGFREILHHGGRLPVGGEPSALQGTRGFSRRPIYHTGEWPHEGVDFTGLRVGVIGTGSSAIQSIPIIAQQASALTVFQRTATYSVPAWNAKLTPEYRQSIKADYPALRAKARARPTGFYFPFNMKPALEASPQERERQYEEAWAARRAAVSRRLWRSSVREGGQRHHRRIRAQQDPRHRQGSRNRRAAVPGQRVRLQSASASIPAISRPTICRMSNWSTCRRRRSSVSRPAASRLTAPNIRSTPSSARPALPR